jgi:hypothetical protein
MTRWTWEKLEDFYQDLLQHHWPVAPMVDMVRGIITSPYKTGLYASTSLATLRIGPGGWERHTLLVLPGTRDDDRLLFRYEGWVTRSHDGFGTLERFLRRVGWFNEFTPAV